MSKSIGGKDYKPQSLDDTLQDFKKIGKGLLVGETADILGLPETLLVCIMTLDTVRHQREYKV